MIQMKTVVIHMLILRTMKEVLMYGHLLQLFIMMLQKVDCPLPMVTQYRQAKTL